MILKEIIVYIHKKEGMENHEKCKRFKSMHTYVINERERENNKISEKIKLQFAKNI